MKAKDLMHVIGDIDENFIIEAKGKQAIVSRRGGIFRKFAIAAAFLLMVGTVFLYQSRQTPEIVKDPISEKEPVRNAKEQKKPEDKGTELAKEPEKENADNIQKGEESEKKPQTAELPKLRIAALNPDGMGFEGYNVKDISDLDVQSPWDSKWGLTELPVYKNRYISRGEDGLPILPDYDAMQEKCERIAKGLGIEPKELEFTRNMSNEELTEIMNQMKESGKEVDLKVLKGASLTAKGQGVEISITPDLTAAIYFQPPRATGLGSPEGYEDKSVFNSSLYSALNDEFSRLFGFEKPVYERGANGYDLNGTLTFRPRIRDESGEYAELMKNYTFKQIRFGADMDGNLMVVHMSDGEGLESIGSYPILTEEQARNQLLAGRYLTTAPEAFSGEGNIGKVELVYKEDLAEHFLPYYKYYVKIENTEEASALGLTGYAAYYVPAVNPEYIDTTTGWGGSFN